MKVIIINGTARSGKDTFVNLFSKNYPYQCLNWSTIDVVKEIAEKHLGWNGEKNDASRLFLSEFKRIWNDLNNGAFKFMIKKIDQHYASLSEGEKNGVVYFIHCREPGEIKQFKQKYSISCITIQLKRSNTKVPNNKSDKNVNNYNYEYTVENNDDIRSLEKKAKQFVHFVYTR